MTFLLYLIDFSQFAVNFLIRLIDIFDDFF